MTNILQFSDSLPNTHNASVSGHAEYSPLATDDKYKITMKAIEIREDG